jgi:hypothetical protein
MGMNLFRAATEIRRTLQRMVPNLMKLFGNKVDGLGTFYDD